MSLARRFAHGSAWVVLGTTADNVIQFIIFVILAKLLTIKALGIVTFAVLFIDVSRVFVAGGLPTTLIQRAEWDDHISSVCFTYNALMALLVSALFIAIGAPLMEHFYGSGSGLVTVCLSLVFFIDAIKAVHAAKLRRDMDYRSLAIRGTFAGVISGAVAISLALNGAGVWSLVFQRLANQSVLTVMTWRAAAWRPKLAIDRASLREVMPFGVRVTMTRAFDMLNQRIPDMIVGFIMGPVGVAIYRVGARALETLRRIAIMPFQDASFSALSRLKSNSAIIHAYLRIIRAAATITFPIFLGSTVIAFEVTVTLFGDKYAASGDVFALFALAGIPNMFTAFAAAAFMAAGQPHIGTWTNAVLLGLNLLLIPVLVMNFGTFGAAAGNLAAFVLVLPLVILLLKRRLGLKLRALAGAVAAPAAMAATMAAVLWLIKLFVLPPLARPVEVVVLVAIGALLYGGMFALAGRTHLRELLTDMKPILPRNVYHSLGKLSIFR